VRDAGERGPYFLAGDDPLVALTLGPTAHVAEIGAGVRLRIPLAPELLRARDRRQEAALLLLRAERDQRRPEEPLADVAEPPGCSRAGVLLVEDDLPTEGEPTAAVLARPAEAGPAGPRERPLPCAATLER